MLTISCITCNFCALNIINRKKAGGDVMARYSNLLPVGILRVMFQLVFVCTCIMLCLCHGTVPRR